MTSPLFLTGFMAAGKTSIGRARAEASGRRFLDLDDVIAEAGEPVAQLVARDEAEFRRREAAALAAVIESSSDSAVIATGGGAAAYGDNMTKMLSAGVVIALGVDVATAQARAAGGPSRPLLSSAAELAAKRAPIYRRAHAVVDTTSRSIAEVVAAVAAVERAWQRLPFAHRDATILALAERSYPVVVHERAIAAELIRTYLEGATLVVVTTDHTVGRHWQSAVVAAVPDAQVVAIAPGEASKSLAIYHGLCEELVARGLDRGSLVIALGGGVVGDLAGFVAAT